MIALKSNAEIRRMKAAGNVVAQALALAAAMAQPGVLLSEIDSEVEALIRKRKARPSFKGYRGFPASICASVNEQIVHGIPVPRVLRAGDLLTVDVGACLNGFHADAAVTVAVGRTDKASTRLLKATRECLAKAIAQTQPGNMLSDLARAIEGHAKRHRYAVVSDYAGHGIGRKLHEDPEVPNVVRDAERNDLPLVPGLVIAIEPMLNAGTARTKTLADRWTVVTADGKRSAHFEHTVAVTEKGPWVLTALEAD